MEEKRIMLEKETMQSVKKRLLDATERYEKCDKLARQTLVGALRSVRLADGAETERAKDCSFKQYDVLIQEFERYLVKVEGATEGFRLREMVNQKWKGGDC